MEVNDNFAHRGIPDLYLERDMVFDRSWKEFCAFLRGQLRKSHIPWQVRQNCMESIRIIDQIMRREKAGDSKDEIIKDLSSQISRFRKSILTTAKEAPESQHTSSPKPQPKSSMASSEQEKASESVDERIKRLTETCNDLYHGDWRAFIGRLETIITNVAKHLTHKKNASSDRKFIFETILGEKAPDLPIALLSNRKKPPQWRGRSGTAEISVNSD